MRAAALLLAATGCAAIDGAPLDVSRAQTLVLSEPGVGLIALRASAFAPTVLPPGAFVMLFEDDLDALRIEAGLLALAAEGACEVDTLTSDEADEIWCATADELARCTPDEPVRLAQRPYLGVPTCSKWALDGGSKLSFDLPRGADHSGLFALSMRPGRVLLGQLHLPTGPQRTYIELADTLATGSSTITLVRSARAVVSGTVTRAAARDEDTAYLLREDGSVLLYDARGGSPQPLIEPLHGAGRFMEIVRSPTDPDALYAATEQCALVERMGARWRVRVPAVDSGAFDVLERVSPCTPSLEWLPTGELLATGVATGRVASEAELIAQLKGVVSVTGDRIDWTKIGADDEDEDEHPTSLTGVGSYVTDDGAIMRLVTGVRSSEIELLRYFWFVQDPRRGDGWVRIEDLDRTTAPGVHDFVRTPTGVLATGGFTQGFSEEIWREEPEAALSARIGLTFLDGRQGWTGIADDGRGGFILSAAFGNANGKVFEWYRPRR